MRTRSPTLHDSSGFGDGDGSDISDNDGARDGNGDGSDIGSDISDYDGADDGDGDGSDISDNDGDGVVQSDSNCAADEGIFTYQDHES